MPQVLKYEPMTQIFYFYFKVTKTIIRVYYSYISASGRWLVVSPDLQVEFPLDFKDTAMVLSSSHHCLEMPLNDPVLRVKVNLSSIVSKALGSVFGAWVWSL